MDFIDEKDDLTCTVNDFLDYAFETFLELSLVFCSRNEGAHVQGIDFLGLKVLRNLSVNYVLGNPFRDSRLSHARFANQDRVVFSPSGKDLQHTADFVITPNHRVQLALCRALVQIDSESL